MIDRVYYSIGPKVRGTHHFAAWWSAPPTATPFRPPNFHNAAATYEQAERQISFWLRVHKRDDVTIVREQLPSTWVTAAQRAARGQRPWHGDPPPDPGVDPGPDIGPSLVMLGLERGCTAADVQAAYRRLAFENHPDRGGDVARFRELTRARERALEGLA